MGTIDIAFSAQDAWWSREARTSKAALNKRERRAVHTRLERARQLDELDLAPDRDLTGRRITIEEAC